MSFKIPYEKNVSLAGRTSLGVGGSASIFVSITNPEQLGATVDLSVDLGLDTCILGEGSNVVVSDSGFDGVVIKMNNLGISIIDQTDNLVSVRVSSGENWDDFVVHCISNGWWGVENLSLIPGSVGACPVQNIGAYGQEVKNVIKQVNVFDIDTKTFMSLSNIECNFGFRSSVFNTTFAGKYIIVSVDFDLSKTVSPCLTRVELKKNLVHLDSVNLQSEIRNTVINFRTNGIGLPNQIGVGSAGTFFRTAIIEPKEVPKVVFKTLIGLGPKMALVVLLFGWKYRSAEGFRLPSKMLIEASGLDLTKFGNVYLYKTNLALVATQLCSSPSSSDVLKIIRKVRTVVNKKTGVLIPIEPTLIGFSKAEIERIFN